MNWGGGCKYSDDNSGQKVINLDFGTVLGLIRIANNNVYSWANLLELIYVNQVYLHWA